MLNTTSSQIMLGIMQYRIIPAKLIIDVIITISNILHKINYELSSIICTVHPLSVDSASNTSIIVSVQIDFTASKHILRISLLHRAIVHEPVFGLLSNKG